MNIIAVDPGANGAIAWRNCNGVHFEPMPKTRGDAIRLIRNITSPSPGEWLAYHEKINGFIPDGGAGQMFEFGKNCERIGCILETLGVRLIEIMPKAWQKGLSLGSAERIKVPNAPKGSTTKEKALFKSAYAIEIRHAKDHNAKAKRVWKNKLKSEAQRRFPDIRVTLDNCDALLILDHASTIQ